MSNPEYLAQARKLLTEDYKTKHANEYNSWLARQQHSWMQPHIVVPFPPFIVSAALAPFKASVSAPSEEAIVAKALELYKQFNPEPVAKEQPVAESVAVAEPIVEPVREPITTPDAIHKIFQEPVEAESLVAEIIPEPIPKPVVEPVVESVVEEIVATVPTPADTIHKIFQQPVAEEVTAIPVTDTMPLTIEAALGVVPQPAEELARAKNSGRILPSVLQRLRDMKDKWSTPEETNV